MKVARKRLDAGVVVAVLATLALLATACGGGSDGGSTTTLDLNRDSTLDDRASSPDSGDSDESGESFGTADPTPVPEPTAEPPAERTIEDVQASTIRITAQGTFQPTGESGELVTSWSGTGFFIDSEGIAVTNNHVVTGSAFLEVLVPGVEEPLNAVVLGASECSDLAVIDVEGSGYQALEFRTEPVNPGLSVFAAGYPGSGIDGGIIENRDYTVTGGVVSNTTGTGDTRFSSVETVVEHDAKIRGGNSGGPLVDEQARVVAINYFGGDTDDFNLAIAAQQARPLIDQLIQGHTEWIGVNGEAIVTDEFSGVWVQSVESASPADGAGVLPGDIILTMEGLPIAADGTMATYCDVVRSHSLTEAIEIEVLRFATEEVLVGQLNGDPLTQSFSFAQELADDMSDMPADSGTTESYVDYERISDDTGRISVEVPVVWADRNGVLNENFGPSIYVAPDLVGFEESWLVPGLVLEVSFDLGPGDHDAVLDGFDLSGACEPGGREDFATADGVFSGRWEFWSDCGGTGAAALTLAASPQAGGMVVRMLAQIASDADIEAVDRAISTFGVQ